MELLIVGRKRITFRLQFCGVGLCGRQLGSDICLRLLDLIRKIRVRLDAEGAQDQKEKPDRNPYKERKQLCPVRQSGSDGLSSFNLNDPLVLIVLFDNIVYLAAEGRS